MRLILITTLMAALNGLADVKPSALFSDHMVIQHGMEVPVWGNAAPKEQVTVSFAGQRLQTKADSEGKWSIKLKPMEISAKGRSMTISGADEVELKDVLVGEVWICAGQSNMQMGLSSVSEIKKLTSRKSKVRSFEVAKVVAFEEQDSLNGSWQNNFPNSAVAASFAHFLEQSVDIPVGIILSSWGSSSLEAWMPRDMTKQLPLFKQQMDEFDANEEAIARIDGIIKSREPRKKNDDIFIRRQPNIVYNAMIAPLVPYACRGLVWYQGERNAMNYDEIPKAPWYRRTIPMTGYGEALKLWIKRYRQEWKRDDFAFIVVMLPGYAKGLEKVPESPIEKSWAWMREAQLEALELSNTSVVNTIDLGDAKNIHPKDKLPIGERLALQVQRNYFKMNVLADGPILKEVKIRGGKLVVKFENSKGLKTKDGKKPSGFWISSDEKKWVPALAEIVNGEVVLTSTGLKKPKFVRYAFAAKPKINLINSAGLPAHPFRTDKTQ